MGISHLISPRFVSFSFRNLITHPKSSSRTSIAGNRLRWCVAVGSKHGAQDMSME